MRGKPKPKVIDYSKELIEKKKKKDKESRLKEEEAREIKILEFCKDINYIYIPPKEPSAYVLSRALPNKLLLLNLQEKCVEYKKITIKIPDLATFLQVENILYHSGGSIETEGEYWGHDITYHSSSYIFKRINLPECTKIGELGRMRFSREGHGMAYLDNIIYIIGGYSTRDLESFTNYHDIVEKFNTRSQKWEGIWKLNKQTGVEIEGEEETQLKINTKMFDVNALVLADRYIYAIGVRKGKQTNIPVIERYDSYNPYVFTQIYIDTKLLSPFTPKQFVYLEHSFLIFGGWNATKKNKCPLRYIYGLQGGVEDIGINILPSLNRPIFDYAPFNLYLGKFNQIILGHRIQVVDKRITLIKLSTANWRIIEEDLDLLDELV